MTVSTIYCEVQYKYEKSPSLIIDWLDQFWFFNENIGGWREKMNLNWNLVLKKKKKKNEKNIIVGASASKKLTGIRMLNIKGTKFQEN